MTVDELGFGLMVGGFGAVWIGAANYVSRRRIERSRGPLGRKHAFWWRWGLVAPDWASLTIGLLGLAAALIGAILRLVG